MELVVAVHAMSAGFPPDERFGLIQQIRRAAVSVPSNIAEGHERRSRADYRRFVAIACGSVAEVETQLDVAVRLGYTTREACGRASPLADEVGKMLRAIERALREDRIGEDAAPYAVRFPQPSALSPQPS